MTLYIGSNRCFLLLLLTQLSRLHFRHELEVFVQDSGKHEQTVEENRRREDETDEHSIGIKVLLSTVEHPVSRCNLVEKLGEIHQQYCMHMLCRK